ncbi:membrane protein [Planobispora rosea]|uniref:Membrane protein n=1 Tax=Planobispora rosea TaxID=35762 RepID=A0A8J3S5C7_PLARO|nr:membrane protein [Planobispora rosea]GIH87488.1 membrane protein [Planobispora rosea]
MPAGLIALCAVPVIAGAVRLGELTAGAEITAQNARFFAAPVPVVLHILTVSVYGLLGAFQFAPGFRRRRPGWHRAAGRILVPCGLLAALSGLWMTLFYPLPDGDGALLSGFRLVFGSAMALSIVLGLAAIRRRDVTRHRAWMIRGYAIGLGAGTQVLTNLPWFLIFGEPGETSRALLMGAGWAINLAMAEWIIRGNGARARAGS